MVAGGSALTRASMGRQELAAAVFLGVVVLGFVYSAIRVVADGGGGEGNLAAQQALAFIEGRWDIRSATPLYDSAYVDGRYYSAFPPFPALLLVPFVLVFGIGGTKSALLALILTVIAGVVLFRLFGILGLPRGPAIWFTGAFFLGTGYWFLIMGSGSVYMYSQVVAVTFTICSLYFLLRERPSAALSGLCLGLAFLSRQMTIYIAIFCIAFLWTKVAQREWRNFVRPLVAFALPVVGCLVAYLVFNAVRFGSPFDTGYEYIVLTTFLNDRVDVHGLFSPAYIPFNFSSMFLSGFELEFGGSDLLAVERMSPWGTSILFASPFVLTAFYARGSRVLMAAGWISVGLALIHTLCYYNNGWVQVNTNRFALDFLPLLMVLCATGLKSAPSILWKAGVVWALSLNVIAHVVLSFMHLGYLDTY